MAKKGQSFNKYSMDLKLKTHNERINQGKSCGYLGRKHQMSKQTTETMGMYILKRL